MGSSQANAGNPQIELRVQNNSPQRDDYPSENELENRIKNLDKLVDSTHAALEQVSYSGKPCALDLVTDLRVKIKASHDLLRVAKLLRDPARKSMFSKIRDSLNELEDVVASHLGVRMN